MSRVIILGYGVSGKAAERHFRAQGIEPIILQNDEPFVFREDDFVVKSPGIRPDHPWVMSAKRVVEEAELGLQRLKGTVLGITGSNGKTTTTLLVAHITGATACGNVGLPLLEARGDFFVVELSSFQLQGMQGGPYFDAALILNISPNHLDWHRSMEEYVAAKYRLAACMKPEGRFFKEGSFDENLESIFGSGYRSEIDRQNVAAAWALCQTVGITKERFLERLATFKRPPHRMELVASRGDIDFINDSKATSVAAVVRALASIKKPIWLIAGGVDKGGDFAMLGQEKNVCAVFALGQAAARIEREMGHLRPVFRVASLEEAVKRARSAAKAGECVLLSPGCSSYDQFRNFEERGERFREFVLSEGCDEP